VVCFANTHGFIGGVAAIGRRGMSVNVKFLRNVLLKALGLFVAFNLVFAILPPLEGRRWSLYQGVLPGRERLPFGETPQRAYNLSLYDLDAMMASLRLANGRKPADEFRVVLIGDSATWGTLLRPQETLAGQLDAAGLKLPDGRKIRFYNLGYPTMSLTKDLMILDAVMEYEPDLVIWLVTLESFPKDKQLESPLAQNNARRVQHLISAYNLSLTPPPLPTFLQRTWVGQRRALADRLRLQLYGVMWAATRIDQDYPETFTPAARDLEADFTFHQWMGPSLPEEEMFYEAFAAAKQIVGDVPLLVVNEPILVSRGQNSDMRYNFYYPRWAYDDYRRQLTDKLSEVGLLYLDAWDVVAEVEFTNSAVHLSPAGSKQFAQVMQDWLWNWMAER
jgi:hypothetical protein